MDIKDLYNTPSSKNIFFKFDHEFTNSQLAKFMLCNLLI